ncbi:MULTISPECIES: phosphatase PAP2 family protein [Streptomyces]|uniref:Phosphatase PAP2 family protein n=2 Tax=Streptomyces TaxID=1883 RepID=A0ABU2RN63_9ACTN|nr:MULTISPECIES: phosphatase PAP2 family protein [unclassified Streptomyces]MBK3590937.1 phosphatase PAP2 family protein [Streptomyces sp. MBT51]MDT0430302.1 phosphatase PAP2 family protein [Streptomyces sp. DSM 41770]
MGDAHVTTQEDRRAVTPSLVADGPRPAGSTRTTARARLGSLRSPRRPRLWFEILLIAVSYWLYSLVRNAVPEQKAAALRNADWIWSLEHSVGLAFEETVNHAVNSVTWLIVSMNYYYATLHFIVTIAVLVWLFRRHPGRYAATRLVLFATTAVALLGYYLFPLAPPRLMRGGGFVDTVLLHQTWGSMASGNFKQMSNQYAAMPSMHIGWSLWCGLTIFALARVPWVRVLGLLYPAATLVVIVSTANHFWLDAVGGMTCLAFGYAVSYAWYGALPHRLPKVVPARAGRGRPRALRRPSGPSGPTAPAARPSAPSAGRPVAPRRPEPDPAAAVPPTPPGA